MKDLLITIDGPAGAGKSSVSNRLAAMLGYTYVDTGALYRAVALAAMSEGCSADDDRGLERVCEKQYLTFENSPTGPRLCANGQDITGLIRTPEITMLASRISAKPVVREYLLDVQRDMGIRGGVVFEGRDMGTVVFPDADIKFYLYADSKTRAERRYKELATVDAAATLDDVRKAMIKRDEDDSSRKLAPLRPADDAIMIDSTHLGIEEVIELMFDHIKPLMNCKREP